METERYLTVKKVKQLFGWGRWKITRLMQDGKLKYLQESDGGPILIDRLSLDAYLASITH